MTEPVAPRSAPPARGSLHVGAVVAIAIAAVGLVSGVESSGREVASYIAPRADDAPPAQARSYRDMQRQAYGPNAALPAAWWQGLRAAAPPAPPVAVTPEERRAAIERRATRRAYDGAPPTIPHPVDPIGVPACLVCHEAGLQIAALPGAPAMSHARHAGCLQCHVVAADPRRPPGAPPREPIAIASDFVGLGPEPGERAWPGAPPTIPHATTMRIECGSCHGPRGALGLRTPHPWRVSCTQCHAPSAALDQRADIAARSASAGERAP